MSQPFIPRDKPKSWVLFICAALIALLFFAPIIGLGILFDANWLQLLGMFGFFACWCVGALAGVVLTIGNLSGRYRNLQATDWKDQAW